MESESLSQPIIEDGSGSGINPISSDDHLPDDEDAGQDWKEQGSGSGEAPTTITDSPGKLITIIRVVNLLRITTSSLEYFHWYALLGVVYVM